MYNTDDSLPAERAFGESLAAVKTRAHVATLQEHTVDDSFVADFAHLRVVFLLLAGFGGLYLLNVIIHQAFNSCHKLPLFEEF